MRRKSNAYADVSLQHQAEEPDPRFVDLDASKKGFIMLPPWVADKIELAGYSLSNFFSDFSWGRSNYICPDDASRRNVTEVQYPENSNVAKQKAEELIARVASTLSTEDIIDIGLWHYLFSEALHTINRYNGLVTDSQNKFLERARNKSVASWGNNGLFFTFGEVKVNSTPLSEDYFVRTSATEFDEVDYELDTLSCSMKVFGHLFSFTPIKGKDYRDVVRHGLARVHGVSEGGIHGRVKRQGDVVSFGTAGASTIIVPSLATVLNVATLLSPIYFDTEDANSGYAARLDVSEAVEATIKEQIVVFMEEVLSELRRFRDNQEIARSGLLLMYSRLI
jgi:hypothetical protein